MSVRPGFILLYSILLILAVSVLSAGMMTVALRERQIARTHARLMQARATAESTARIAAAEWPALADGMAVGETRVLVSSDFSGHPAAHAAGPVEVAGTRLSPTLYLVSSSADLAEGAKGGRTAGATAGASMLLRTADSALVLGSFPAAVTADSLIEILGGTISGWDACGSSDGSAPGAMAPRVDVYGSPPQGLPPSHEVAPPPRTHGDPLAPDITAAIRDVASTGTVAPAPISSGVECLADPSNWGAISPAHACHELLPLIGAEDGIVVSSGEARAILVVHGDARLDGPLEFEGLILATGHLRIGPDARVRGAVRARHVVVDGGEVRLDRCAQRAVAGAPAFRKPLQPVSRWWIPSF